MTDSRDRKSGRVPRMLRRWLAAALAWSAVGAVAAPAGIPPHWLAYARQAGAVLQQRLGEDTPSATGLHEGMERAAEQPQRQDPVVVKLWIDAEGQVERSEFASLGDADADAALRTLLQGTRLAPPPTDMRQPLVLGLSLRDAMDDAVEPARAGKAD